MAKYQTRDQIFAFIGDLKLEEGFQTMSVDSYNEEEIGKTIKATGLETQLLQCALNIAIVGTGNKKLGSYRVKENIINLKDVFIKAGVNITAVPNLNLKENELTPGRLCRYFRHHIRKYVRETQTQTYLYRKYSNRSKEHFDICFRGAEFLDDLNDTDVKFLCETYANLDKKLGTTLSQRINRVFVAKGKLILEL